ncbi:MAG: Hpt domain-containing protein [Balneola sp.]
MNDIDLSYLNEVTGGSAEIIKEMLVLFLKETPEQIEVLREKSEQKEWDSVKAEAHKLKPTFLYVGVSDIHMKLGKVEAYAKERVNLDEISTLIEEVEIGFKNMKPSLEAKIEEATL